MAAVSSKPLIFVVVALLVVALMFSLYSGFAFAAPKHPNWGKKGDCYLAYEGTTNEVTICCWSEAGVRVCQSCKTGEVATGAKCGEVQRSREVAPPPPPGPKGPLGSIPEGGGVLPGLEQTPPSPPTPNITGEIAPPPPPGPRVPLGAAPEVAPPTAPGAEEQQTQPPTAEDGSQQPPTEPLCPEGQVLDEQSGLCVLEEPQPAEQPEEQPQAEEPEQSSEQEQQPSEGGQ